MAVEAKLKIDDKDIEAAIRSLQGANRSYATVAFAAGAVNVTQATVQLKDGFGKNIAGRRRVEFYMSTDVNGSGLTASAYSGNVTATAGAILTAITAKKHFIGVTDATGKIVFTITDTAEPATERVVVVNADGSLSVSGVTGTSWG